MCLSIYIYLCFVGKETEKGCSFQPSPFHPCGAAGRHGVGEGEARIISLLDMIRNLKVSKTEFFLRLILFEREVCTFLFQGWH